jgi:hypothetical protein
MSLSSRGWTTSFVRNEIYHQFEASFVWNENSASNVDVVVIPSQYKVTQQILIHCHPFLDLKIMFVGSRHAEQLSLLSQQCIVTTDVDSVLRTEVVVFESQEEDSPKCILFCKPIS